MSLHRGRRDAGAVLIIVALCITALFLIVALVVDLGSTRSDRRDGQLAADNAAAAAARAMAESDPATGCASALDFLRVSLGSDVLVPDPGTSCASSFPASCSPLTDERTLTASANGYQVIIYHPVPNGSDLMTRVSAIGATVNPSVVSSDGSQCERMGVRIVSTGNAYFGGIAGSTERRSTVHAVARGRRVAGVERPINLLVLNRTECQSLTVGGGAVVAVRSPTDAPTMPGIVGVDAKAIDGCNGGKSTFEVGGSSSVVAYGPCPDGINTNCGIIDLYEPVTSGACTKDDVDVPACKAYGGSDAANDAMIQPNAISTGNQSKRTSFEHRYNCKLGYTREPLASVQPIDGCSGASATPAYVEDLMTFARGVPADWAVITGSDCSPSTISYPEDNYYVDCPTFKVSAGGTVTFAGGNVVFTGGIDVPGSASLRLNQCSRTDTCALSKMADWEMGDPYDENISTARNAWIYVDDQVRVGGNLDLSATTMFLDANGYFNKNGSGSVTWIAPDELDEAGSAGPFDDLALWSEGKDDHTFQGGGTSEFEGVFYGPLATFSFAGSTPMDMRAAQFASDKMSFTGSTTFTMSPVAARAVSQVSGVETTLIR